MKLNSLKKEDLTIFKSLIGLFNVVFEEDPAIGSDTHSLGLLVNDKFVALAAISEGEVVGGLTAYELPMVYSDSSEMFLYDIAVKSEFQRTGIGKALIRKLREYCTRNGIKEFFVMAHKEDEHAIEFYRSTGGKSEKVVNFLYETVEEKE